MALTDGHLIQMIIAMSVYKSLGDKKTVDVLGMNEKELRIY